MEKWKFEDVSIGMHFKSLIPIERGDGIEFLKGSCFRVTEMIFNGTHDGEQRFTFTLQCTQEGHHSMALPVEIPKHRERGGYMKQLGVTLARLNQQFEKLEDEWAK